MNYLAHAVLSYNDKELLFGNMIADFVKGRNYNEDYSNRIVKGIALHKAIDQFTDKHPAVLRMKNIYRPTYRLYSGAIVDVVMDYYLANDPQIFNSEESLRLFSLNVYSTMDNYINMMPVKYTGMYQFMKSENWLYDIRNLHGLNKALKRLERKAAYLDDTTIAYELSVRHYYELNQGYYELIQDLEKFVKDWFTNNL